MSWEVPIMRSRTSFFNPIVFANDCKRYWPLTAGYTLFWFLLLPLSRLTEYGYDYGQPSDWNMQYETLGITAVGGYVSAFCTGILFAMAMFSYLTNARATNGLHALPERRETLFVTHYLAGLCCQIVPQTVLVLLTMVILGSHGAFDVRITGLMLLTMILPTLFFYSFGVLCMIFTGQILAAPVFYGVLNVLVVGVEMLVRTLAGNFLYGWSSDMTPMLTAFSPMIKLVDEGVRATSTSSEYYSDALRSGERMTGKIIVQGLDLLWIYAAVGLVFAVLALLVYRRRHSEATGSTVAIYWARPVFKYGVTFCAALAIGQLVYYLFFGQYRSNGDYSLPGMIVCMALAGLIGYFAAEMLLKKSFRVWKSGWKGAAAVTAALVLLGVGTTFDLTGYEGYIPNLDSIESVSVDATVYSGKRACFVTSSAPDTIRLAAAAHRAIIDDKAREQGRASRGMPLSWDGEETQGSYFNITYKLKNGSIVRRHYNPVTLYLDEQSAPGTPTAALTALYNDPDVMVMRALGRWGYNAKRDPRTLTDLRFTGGYYDRSKWVNDRYVGEIERDLSPAEAELLYEAALRDAAAGHLAGTLFDGYSQETSIQLYATYLDTWDYRGSTAPAQEEDGRAYIEFELTVTPRMTETLAVLRAMGIDVEL